MLPRDCNVQGCSGPSWVSKPSRARRWSGSASACRPMSPKSKAKLLSAWSVPKPRGPEVFSKHSKARR